MAIRVEDLAHLPVVDVHCHPFVDQGALTVAQFVDAMAFPGGDVAYMEEGGVAATDDVSGEIQALRQNTIYWRYALHRLAEFFACPADVASIAASRNQAVVGGYQAHVQRLFSAVGLETLVTDFGYPQPPVDRSRFRQEMPVEVVPIFRIEPLIADLLKQEMGWAEFRRRYDETIAAALEHEGYRGLKSVIAYRTGLDISPLSRTPDQGRQALEALRAGTGGNATKKLRDHLLCRALELCMEYDVPMQIHTGMGDYDINFLQCRPSLLMDLLRFPVFRACRVLLVHTGYPYHAEAGYMANMLPRVYCDVSEGIPFAGHAAQRIYLEVLEMAPLHKVVYGSDGYTLPEIFYVGARLGRQALAEALSVLVEGGFLDQGEALAAAAGILAGNARRLYGIE